jgi:hypothetical protein
VALEGLRFHFTLPVVSDLAALIFENIIIIVITADVEDAYIHVNMRMVAS